MANLISLQDISLAYGLDHLLDHANLQIESGERVCLIGRNGAGKSSLLKIIDGTIKPDSGTVWLKPQLKMARLEQDLPQNLPHTVFEFVAEGLSHMGKTLADYHALLHQLETDHSDELLKKLERCQHDIDVGNGWQYDQQIQTILTRLELNPDLKIASLSGGWQRRAALAKALVISPDLLLLDEPTNHLDIEAIQWLEDQLLNLNIGLIFITHDRSLLQRLATRIIELDRGKLTSWNCPYNEFLIHKEEALNAEAKHNAEFDKKLAQEEKWVRQGIKARRTRNEGRVRALKKLREIRGQRREVAGNVNFNVNQADKSGQLVVEATNVSHAFNNQCIIKNFSLRVMRGDRIGLIGPNGAGKSTLLNILLGKLTPDSGTIKLGTKMEVAYFDQLRAALHLEKTVAENVVEGSDTLTINGANRHIISYLGDFLFSPQRARTPVKALSGGECNRLLLAKLFSKPSNILVMDEPTNDLDIETLELLEDLLVQYQGTLLLVSHDREFLDNVVTSTLVFSGNGHIESFVGGYQDWLHQKEKDLAKKTEAPKKTMTLQEKAPSKKLSYKDQRELDTLPQRIEQLETEQKNLTDQIANPDFYQQPTDQVNKTLAKLADITKELEQAYQRWEELDN